MSFIASGSLMGDIDINGIISDCARKYGCSRKLVRAIYDSWFTEFQDYCRGVNRDDITCWDDRNTLRLRHIGNFTMYDIELISKYRNEISGKKDLGDYGDSKD